MRAAPWSPDLPQRFVFLSLLMLALWLLLVRAAF